MATVKARNAKPGEEFRGEAAKHPCGSSGGGRHACITHDQSFGSNMEVNSHVEENEERGEQCVLVWVCFEHGVEVP